MPPPTNTQKGLVTLLSILQICFMFKVLNLKNGSSKSHPKNPKCEIKCRISPCCICEGIAQDTNP